MYNYCGFWIDIFSAEVMGEPVMGTSKPIRPMKLMKSIKSTESMARM
jgi:hypothetical protein